jgi:hypothetical protein
MGTVETKRDEEAKRDRHWDAAERWRAIQDTITWAENQATVRRNTPKRCLDEQSRKLDSPVRPASR